MNVLTFARPTTTNADPYHHLYYIQTIFLHFNIAKKSHHIWLLSSDDFYPKFFVNCAGSDRDDDDDDDDDEDLITALTDFLSTEINNGSCSLTFGAPWGLGALGPAGPLDKTALTTHDPVIHWWVCIKFCAEYAFHWDMFINFFPCWVYLLINVCPSS